MGRKRWFSQMACAGFMVMFLLVQGVAAAAGMDLGSAADSRLYLLEKYQILWTQAEPTRNDFVQLLAKVNGWGYEGNEAAFSDLHRGSSDYEGAMALYSRGVIAAGKYSGSERLSQREAVSLAVKAAGMKELAYTYSYQQVVNVLNKSHITAGEWAAGKIGQEIALGIDIGMIQPADWNFESKDAYCTGDQGVVLAYQVLAMGGKARNVLGTVNDPDIYAKVKQAWQAAPLLKETDLLDLANQGLKEKLMTGYNLRDIQQDARFLNKNYIRYGHSDITHALQLIGLLRKEGIQAKVHFEPKTSAYVYLKEWGEPSVGPDFEVLPTGDGNYIAYAKEYDISFEFVTAEDKERFQPVVLKYAKKNSKDQQGLIYQSWWQPLYTSEVPMKDYKSIVDHRIVKGHYAIHIYALPEASEALVAGLGKIAPDCNVVTQNLWVDEPFYHYLLGDYK